VFEVNDLLTALGVVTPPAAPGQPLSVAPIHEEALTEEWMKQNQWDSWDEASWHALLKTPAVFLSDRPQKGVDEMAVPRIPELPAYMTTYVPAMSPWAPGATMIPASGPPMVPAGFAPQAAFVPAVAPQIAYAPAIPVAASAAAMPPAMNPEVSGGYNPPKTLMQ
jgi:hypothetical protein